MGISELKHKISVTDNLVSLFYKLKREDTLENFSKSHFN